MKATLGGCSPCNPAPPTGSVGFGCNWALARVAPKLLRKSVSCESPSVMLCVKSLCSQSHWTVWVGGATFPSALPLAFLNMSRDATRRLHAFTAWPDEIHNAPTDRETKSNNKNTNNNSTRTGIGICPLCPSPCETCCLLAARLVLSRRAAGCADHCRCSGRKANRGCLSQTSAVTSPCTLTGSSVTSPRPFNLG